MKYRHRPQGDAFDLWLTALDCFVVRPLERSIKTLTGRWRGRRPPPPEGRGCPRCRRRRRRRRR